MASFDEWYQAVKESVEQTSEAKDVEKVRILQAIENAKPFIQTINTKADELGLTKEEFYVLSYITRHSKFEELKPNAHDFTILQLTSMMYIHQYKQEVIALFDLKKRKDFINNLTTADLKSLKLDPNKANITAFINNAEPTVDDVLDIIGFGNYVHLYKSKQQGYRTRSKASPDIVRTLPQSLAIPTLQGYQYATSLYQNGNAYMQKLTSTDGLKFQKGKIFFEGGLQTVSEAELQNMRTKEGIEKIDLALLRVFYSIILTAFEKTGCKEIKPVITLFVPDMAEYLGLQSNLNRKDKAGIIEKVQTFHNIVGILHETRNGKPTQSIYPVLNFEGYNDRKNTISFSSPYMNHVIQTVYDVAIKRDKKTGKPKLKTNGEPLRLASHSYLVRSEIGKERNKAAVENVFIITALIEQAGDNIPNIKASTIVERNPQLQQRLEETQSSNRGRLLQRTFEKTWELLRCKTRLQEVYKEIKLPEPKDPATIPTPKTLSELVFTFPHKGKKTAE